MLRLEESAFLQSSFLPSAGGGGEAELWEEGVIQGKGGEDPRPAWVWRQPWPSLVMLTLMKADF